MGNWRRRQQGGEFNDQEVYRVRSDYRKPSQGMYIIFFSGFLLFLLLKLLL